MYDYATQKASILLVVIASKDINLKSLSLFHLDTVRDSGVEMLALAHPHITGPRYGANDFHKPTDVEDDGYHPRCWLYNSQKK
jgi:hypothetical protein